MYGIVYMAGYTSSWCTTGSNSMIIFKNNFDFDMWEGHSPGNYWDTFIIAYVGYGIQYPNYWYNDAN